MVSSEFQSDIQPFCVLISRRSRSRHRAAHALNSFHEVQQRRVWKRATHMSFSTFPMAGRVTQARGITISDFIFRHRTGDFSEKEPAECFRVKFAARWTVLHDHRSSCPPLQQVYSILRPEHPARMIGVSFKQNIVGWRWFQKPKWAMYRLDARIRRVYQHGLFLVSWNRNWLPNNDKLPTFIILATYFYNKISPSRWTSEERGITLHDIFWTF